MSLTKEKVDNNIEKILYNNKPATFSGIVVIKDLSKKGWIIIDCSNDDKITRGMQNVAKQLNVKLNIQNFYCKYNENDKFSLIENQEYNVVAEIFLSKGTTLYGNVKQLNPLEKNIENKIIDKNINQKKEISLSENISKNINFSDETINKIKKIMKESFTEVLEESTKNLNALVEVIKELAEVIDKKGTDSFNINQSHNIDEDIPFDKEKKPFEEYEVDFPHEEYIQNEEDLQNDL